MIKYLFIIFFLFYSGVFSQTTDTLINVPGSLAVDTLSVITNNDSLFVNDSTKTPDEIVKPDSLIPIQGIPLTDASQIINKRTFLFYNYRYTGDFLRLFPLNFIKDLGFMGQPNETFVYGAGAGGVSFMEDGVLWNNRFTNALDLNHIQSEDIDSIEIVPSPRGFLYGPYNNPVAVNFIMKDFLSPEPYSRIKYYEGPDGEAMFDGKFNAQVAKKWNLSFQLTNRSTDSSFVNNGFSIWQVNTKLKYYLSNSINLSAVYSFVNADVGLNGGVDVDSIAKITNDINSILYDGQSAPVVYPNRGESVINHNFRLRVQTLSFDHSKVDLSFYYKYGENEITNKLDTIVTRDKFENKTLGSTISYGQKVGILTAKIYGSFEKNSLLTTYENKEVSTKTTDFTYISAGGVLSAGLLSGKLVPSIFYKYFNQNYTEFGKDYVNSNSGLGADLFYKVFNNLSLYAGYSMYNQFDLGDARNFEISAKYNDEIIFFNMKYFERKNFIPYSVAIPLWTGIEMGIPKQEIKGVGVKASIKLWKLLMETNTSYYFNADNNQLIGVPELQFVGGVFLNGFFFDDNLFLKAGLQFYYTGTNNVYSNVWKETIVVEPSNKVDITVAGEIKGVAIVYVGLENLFGNRYFITPYYPMQERNFRFGLSWELFN